MANYLVASEEGANKYGADVGDTVQLDLEPGEELAVICAGWLEPAKTKQAKEADN